MNKNELLNDLVLSLTEKEPPISSNPNIIENNDIGYQPTKKWLKNYRISSIDICVMENIFSSSIEETLEGLLDVIEDNEGLCTNFPSYTKKEMEDFINEKYLKKSKFISKLKSFLRKERKLISESYTQNEKDWIEENLYW
jgi:hypothetical protein